MSQKYDTLFKSSFFILFLQDGLMCTFMILTTFEFNSIIYQKTYLLIMQNYHGKQYAIKPHPITRTHSESLMNLIQFGKPLAHPQHVFSFIDKRYIFDFAYRLYDYYKYMSNSKE